MKPQVSRRSGTAASRALESDGIERLRAVIPAGQTCSVGLVMHQVGEPSRDLLVCVDRVLYSSKADGRDRVTVAG